MQGIHGKHVLITGSSSGIGQAIAIRFAQEGANVAINYRKSAAEAEMTLEQIHAATDQTNQRSGKHILVQADVAKEEDVVRMMATTLSELGGLDILINNAGIQTPADAHEMTTESFDRVLGVNLRGAFMCAREAIKHFLAENNPGAIVNF
jgi:glucose 1-dehydrogenase